MRHCTTLQLHISLKNKVYPKYLSITINTWETLYLNFWIEMVDYAAAIALVVKIVCFGALASSDLKC